ncbi:hypothetical protein J5N97_016889 [Dioscorea zingiberensis]|uniref:NAC domain-containing protein n=1 Tax=Dioscorea zingiberensis TaxID=325984 RepID=A0A9D5CL12_9LILI|nr:hypothetical protein J5N97_016889 [Dioscorea zingiberensis]
MEDELDLMPLGKRQRALLSIKSSSPTAVSSTPACSGGVSVGPVLNEVLEKWPGLPRGVKFDPSDEDLVWHLLAKAGKGKDMPHPFINMFVNSLDDETAIGYNHPESVLGVKKDGNPSYFFHRALKTQCQSRKKMHNDNYGNFCWNKVGKAKPLLVDGIYPGCKKIMALHVNEKNDGIPEKTNWVMHQYHLGEEEFEGELVLSKIFYQQRPKTSKEDAQDMVSDSLGAVLSEVEPLLGAELVGSESHNENQHPDINYVLKPAQISACCAIGGTNSAYFEQQKIDCGNHPEPFASGEEKYIRSCEYNQSQISWCDSSEDARRCQKDASPRSSIQQVNDVSKCKKHLIVKKQARKEFYGYSAEKDAPMSISTSNPNSSESVITQSQLVADQILSIADNKKSNITVQSIHCAESKEIDQILSYQASISDVKYPQTSSGPQTCNTSKTNEFVFLRNDTCAIEKNIGSSCMLSEARSHSDSLSSMIHVSLESRDETRISDANLSSNQELKSENINDDSLLLDPVLPALPFKVKQEPSEGEADSIHDAHNDIGTHYMSVDNHSQDNHLSGGRNPQNCLSVSGLILERTCVDTQCSAKAANYPDNILLDKGNLPAETVNICYFHGPHPEEQNLKVADKLSNSASSNLIGKVKFEPLENLTLVPCQKALPSFLDQSMQREEVKMELADDNSVDIDNIPLIERMKMRRSLTVPGIDCRAKERCSQPAAFHAPSFDSVNSENVQRKCFALRKKRKKTATDSVEKALEEDAPGLLEVLLDKGITVGEIKLYGDANDADDPIDVSLDENSFEDLERVITKFCSEHSSLFKFPSVRHIRGSKVDYCLPCLISLIEQTRYLRFRNNPVEWGWCRDLQSFIFVFEKHNRIVLERPEYGYATYFFELVDSLPIDWQVRRLVIAMKLTSCSRTAIIENKTIPIEDLTEGEARVLKDYGWKPNSGLGSMLNYCDRVVHDKRNDSFISEWRTRIGKLLMQGYDGGRTVLANLPKKVVEYMGNGNLEVKLEPEKLVEPAGNSYLVTKLEG